MMKVCLFLVYIAMMEKKMETTIVYWWSLRKGHLGIVEKKMEATIQGLGLRVQGFGLTLNPSSLELLEQGMNPCVLSLRARNRHPLKQTSVGHQLGNSIV